MPKKVNAPFSLYSVFLLSQQQSKILNECYLSDKDKLKTPTKYCSAANLELSAKLKQNNQKEGGYELLKIIKFKPLKATQKTKATVVEVSSNIEKREQL